MMNLLRRWFNWCGPRGSLNNGFGSPGIFICTAIPMIVVAGLVAAPPIAWTLYAVIRFIGPAYLALFP